MDNWRGSLYKLAQAQHGAVGLHQVTRLEGSTKTHMRELNGAGWDAPYPSVRLRTGAPRTRECLASCAVLELGPGAALAHDSAASWWGLEGFALLPHQVLRLKSARRYRVPAHIVLRETRRLPASHITTLKGVSVVRPERLPFDLIQEHSAHKVEVLIDRMLHKRLTSTDRLHEMASELGGRGAKGIGHIRRLLKERPAGYVPPESGLESRLKWIAERYLLPPLRPQVNLGSADEWIARVDFLAGDNVVVWVQSELYHTALVDKRKDDLQRIKLQAQGFVVIEVWQDEIWNKPEAAASRIRTAIAQNRAA